jgi:serine/threonine protein kinase
LGKREDAPWIFKAYLNRTMPDDGRFAALDSRLEELLRRWKDLRQAGSRVPTPEQLCQDCPELLPAVRQRLQALQAEAGLDSATVDEGTLDAEPAKATILAATAPGPIGGPTPTAAVPLPDLPGYEILAELGRGGMGVVYLGRQLRLKRLVALKMLLAGQQASLAQRQRFEAEMESIARLQHPNLVQIFEVGEHEGRPFFAMEYVDGGSLEDQMASRPPARKAAELMEVVSRAIHAAHERGVIHRDLKPANVLLTADGVPKISDFGLARRMDVINGPTPSKQVLGTPGYMSPEQAIGRSRQAGPATDIYSLGAILYELLTGRPPFEGETSIQVLYQVASAEPVSPRRLQPGIAAQLDTICLKCLEKSPQRRYLSAAALADDLHRFLASEPIQARPISSWRHLARWARRRPAIAASLAIVAIGLLALLATSWWFTQQLATELANTEAARRDLDEALARQVAQGLDRDLRQLEMVPQSVAALLAERRDWRNQSLEGWLRSLVAKDDRVFGLCVALEEGEFSGDRGPKDYCLYVHERPGGLSAKQLLPPTYPPPFYRDRDWYTAPRTTRQLIWSEPYQEPAAGNRPMVTYSVPFNRDGKFAGVVSADLSIAYLRRLHQQLEQLDSGPDRFHFVVSRQGTILCHPDSSYEFPAKAAVLERMAQARDFLALEQQMRQEETGRGRAMDFHTGRPATFFFVRIPATGWHLVVVHPDRATDAT